MGNSITLKKQMGNTWCQITQTHASAWEDYEVYGYVYENAYSYNMEMNVCTTPTGWNGFVLTECSSTQAKYDFYFLDPDCEGAGLTITVPADTWIDDPWSSGWYAKYSVAIVTPAEASG